MLAAIAAILILFASQAVGQQMHRIGFLGAAVVPVPEQAFVDVLRTRGYVVGENLEIDFSHHSLPLFLSDAPQCHVGPRPAGTVAVRSASPESAADRAQKRPTRALTPPRSIA